MGNFTAPCIIESLRTLKDGSVRITVDTYELTPSDFAALAGFRNKAGFLLFKEARFEEGDLEHIPDVVPEIKGDKTPSQRLRGVFYRLWEQTDKSTNWKHWYEEKMEAVISYYKEKLP